MKKVIAVILILVIALLSISCSGSKSIVGKWKADDDSKFPLEGVDTFAVFTKDGEFKIEFDTSQASEEVKNQVDQIVQTGLFDGMTYEVDGDKLTTTTMGESETATFKIEGDKLTMFDADGQPSGHFTRAK